MQVTALSSSDSVRLRLEDASPAEELRKGIRHRPDTLSGYSAARMSAGARKVAVWTDAEIFFLVYVLAIILLCESAVAGGEKIWSGYDIFPYFGYFCLICLPYLDDTCSERMLPDTVFNSYLYGFQIPGGYGGRCLVGFLFLYEGPSYDEWRRKQ